MTGYWALLFAIEIHKRIFVGRKGKGKGLIGVIYYGRCVKGRKWGGVGRGGEDLEM